MSRQSISLQSGWNAVYLSVSPEASAGEFFKGWPVHSVSAYRASEILHTEQLPSGFSGEPAAVIPFGVWTREEPVASSLHAIPADTVLVCFNTNAPGTVAFGVDVFGRPAAPRIIWHGSTADFQTYNYVGVRLTGPVSPVDYFAGAGIGIPSFLKLGGVSEDRPTPYNPQRGTASWQLEDGDVLLIRAEKLSDWAGPLHVSPREGVRFGKEGMMTSVDIRNDGTGDKKVSFSFQRSNDEMLAPELLWQDMSSVFTLSSNHWEKLVLGNVLTKTLAPGETWRIGVAMDRTQFEPRDSGKVFGGLFRIEENAGTRMLVELPCSVEAGTVSEGGGHTPGLWPAGLWVGTAELTKVCHWSDDVLRNDDVGVHSPMRFRLILHVNDDGNVSLLQRVVFAWNRRSDGTSEQVLYSPEAAIPSESDEVTSISCAVLPVSLGMLSSASGKFFGTAAEPLVFSYTISANDPSNPFFHPLNPLFDGLKADFTTPAPDGDDFSNYIGPEKPERFSIDGRIAMAFDPNAGETWAPEETVTGALTWTYGGVRREGPLTASGNFVLTRISALGSIKK